jgi:hypothetical protein
MAKRLSHDFEAKPARNEMGRTPVPIVVPSVVRNPGLAHHAAPKLLYLA